MTAAWVAVLVIAGTAVARADEPAIPPPPPPPAEAPAPEPQPPPQTEPAPTEAQPQPEPKPYDGPYLKTPLRPREIVVDVPRQRSRDSIIVLSALVGATVIAGGIGVYYHLDSRSASDDVSATVFTGHAWSPADQARVDQASSSRTRAAIGYGLSGALLAASITYLIVTEPKSDRTVIRPHHAMVAPLPGGAAVAGAWSW